MVRDLLNMEPLDSEWTLPSSLADNPLVWMVMVDGLIVDVRNALKAIQEIAFEKTLIPYIPYNENPDN